MKVFSSAVSRPVQWSSTCRKYLGMALMLKKLRIEAENVRRAGNGDFRIASDDDGVAVMAGVAPAPDAWIRA